MKILYLTARQPYPYMKGDQLISYHQIKELSKEHEIYLISFYEDFYDECKKEMGKYCKEMMFIKNSSLSKLLSSVKTFINFNSIQSNLFYKSKLNKQIHNFYNKVKPDVVHVLSFRMAGYFMKDDIKKSIDLVDAYSNNMKIRADKTRGLLKLLWKMESHLLKNYEKKILNHYSKVTLVSERDKKYFKEDVLINPVGVDISCGNVKNKNEDQTNIIFQGNMAYYPNVNAVQYIVNKILPILEDKIRYNFYIVGGNPSKEIIKLKRDDITVTGYVKDMGEYLGIADVAIYPIFETTGMQTKIIEAMSYRIPCILSRDCAQGIKEIKGREHVIVASTEQEFADAVLELMSNIKLRDKLINNSMELIKEYYSWEQNIKNLEGLWGENK